MVKKKDKPHYVNNKKFTQAVHEYVLIARRCKESGSKIPTVPDYIAESFIKICEGLSRKSNFSQYTYRDEMVMDAVENCLRAILNYDIEAATRSGYPNAFGYFNRCAWYAFLRRIAKEKKQQDVKYKFIENISVEDLMTHTEGGSHIVEEHYVSLLKNRSAQLQNDKDAEVSAPREEKKTKVKKKKPSESTLDKFMG